MPRPFPHSISSHVLSCSSYIFSFSSYSSLPLLLTSMPCLSSRPTRFPLLRSNAFRLPVSAHPLSAHPLSSLTSFPRTSFPRRYFNVSCVLFFYLYILFLFLFLFLSSLQCLKLSLTLPNFLASAQPLSSSQLTRFPPTCFAPPRFRSPDFLSLDFLSVLQRVLSSVYQLIFCLYSFSLSLFFIFSSLPLHSQISSTSLPDIFWFVFKGCQVADTAAFVSS